MYLLQLIKGYVIAIAVVIIVGFLRDDISVSYGITSVTKVYFLAMLIIGVLFFWKIGWYVIKNRDIYERNREATIVLKKSRTGKMTPDERVRFITFQKNGVLTCNSYGVLRLSDNAVGELFE